MKRSTIETALRIGIPIALEFERVRAEARYDNTLEEYIDEAPAPECAATAGATAGATTPPYVDLNQRIMVPTHRQTTTESIVDPLTYASAIIGQIGEKEVFDILKERFSNIERTNHIAHSGDITLNCDFGRIIVEVKSYTISVPRAQVQKFQRDLIDTGASAGVFISLRSPIAGLREKITITHEYTRKFVPALYLTCPRREDISVAVSIVFQLLGAVDQINSIDAAKNEILQRLCSTDEIAGGIAESRRKCTALTGEITASLSGIIGDLSRAEAQLRDVSDAARNTTQVYDNVSVMREIRVHPRYISYRSDVQKALTQFITRVNKRVPHPVESLWTVAGGRYINKFTGHTFRLMATYPEVTLPRPHVPDTAVISLLNSLSNEINVGKDITVKLTAMSSQKIMEHV